MFRQKNSASVQNYYIIVKIRIQGKKNNLP